MAFLETVGRVLETPLSDSKILLEDTNIGKDRETKRDLTVKKRLHDLIWNGVCYCAELCAGHDLFFFSCNESISAGTDLNHWDQGRFCLARDEIKSSNSDLDPSTVHDIHR